MRIQLCCLGRISLLCLGLLLSACDDNNRILTAEEEAAANAAAANQAFSGFSATVDTNITVRLPTDLSATPAHLSAWLFVASDLDSRWPRTARR